MKDYVNSLDRMFKQKNIEAHKDKSGISILGSKNYIKNTELDLDLNPIVFNDFELKVKREQKYLGQILCANLS